MVVKPYLTNLIIIRKNRKLWREAHEIHLAHRRNSATIGCTNIMKATRRTTKAQATTARQRTVRESPAPYDARPLGQIPSVSDAGGYPQLLSDIAGLLEAARRASARVVNALITATYWNVGRRIVEFEQGGKERAEYGEALLSKLSEDLTGKFGRGFSPDNLESMRRFYMLYKDSTISETPSRKSPEMDAGAHIEILSPLSREAVTPSSSGYNGKSQTVSGQSVTSLSKGCSQILQTPSAIFVLQQVAARFPLPWSSYVRLLAIKDKYARKFYETEALRGGWSVRQLDRQIASLFYERTALSRNKAAMLEKGGKPLPADIITPEQEIKDPFILEFLGLKDEYSETDLEDALVHHLERFLLELGGDFAFIGRQKRLRIGNEWYRVDLLFFHRKLRCLVVIDLKVGKFTHADAGQMHLYLNYAREHWTHTGENPPVGLILCAEKDSAVAKYALAGLPNKVLTAEYKLALPDEKTLAAEIENTRKVLEARK